MPPLHDEVFHKALSSDIRRAILVSLAKKEKYLTEISKEIEKKPQTVDFHLNLLEEIGLVEGEWISSLSLPMRLCSRCGLT